MITRVRAHLFHPLRRLSTRPLVFDLPYSLQFVRGGRANWLDDSHYSRVYKGTAGGEAICFSACDDSQTSADTRAFAKVCTWRVCGRAEGGRGRW